MANEEYGELTEFLGRKFDQMDARLDQTATKEEVGAQQAETRRHFDVVAEGLRDQIRTVAEGVAGVAQRLDQVEQRLDHFQRKVEDEFAETRAAIRFSYAQLERRIQELEGNYASLDERVARLEGREG